MRKEEVKRKLRESIRHMPHREAVVRLALFGSYVHDDATDESDVDVLVDIDPKSNIGFFELSHMMHSLEESVGKKVDLVASDALSKYFRDKVTAESETLYERQ